MKKRFSEEQIIGFLRQAEAGVAIEDLCRQHGFSDASFYTWRAKFGGMEASDVKKMRELQEENDKLSPSGVRSIWLRHDVANFKQRLTALEKHVAATGAVLTEAQVVALEKKRNDDIACGEIETAHPGYLGSQDTFYVGTMKGVGRIYQQTFVDTYSKVAFAKLYSTKTPITSADLLNDRVLPFFAEHDVPNGSRTTIMSARIREKCAVDERRWKRSSMAKKTGRKS